MTPAGCSLAPRLSSGGCAMRPSQPLKAMCPSSPIARYAPRTGSSLPRPMNNPSHGERPAATGQSESHVGVGVSGNVLLAERPGCLLIDASMHIDRKFCRKNLHFETVLGMWRRDTAAESACCWMKIYSRRRRAFQRAPAPFHRPGIPATRPFRNSA